MKIGPKLWPVLCSQGFSMIWPTDLVFDPTWSIFLLNQVWWRLAQNCNLWSVHKVFLWFDLLTLILTPHDPYSNPTEILSRWSFWASLMKIGPKLCPLECSQSFLWFDLLTLFLTQHDPYSFLTKFDEDWTKTVASGVFTRFTRFFYDLTYWPQFWPRMIHIRSWPSMMRIGPKLWPLECSQGFSTIWPTDLVFDPGWSIIDLDEVPWRLDQNCGL